MSRPVRFGTEGQEALAAATAETVVQARGVTTVKFELAEVWASADQEPTTEVENVSWRLLYQTTDGTATGATEVAGSPDDPTPAITAFHSFSAEPTAGSVIAEGEFPANGEMYRYWANEDGNILDNATTSRIGLELTASVIVNVRAGMAFRAQSA